MKSNVNLKLLCISGWSVDYTNYTVKFNFLSIYFCLIPIPVSTRGGDGEWQYLADYQET